MSTDASARSASSIVADDSRTRRAILRFAFGVTGCFVTAEILDWDFAFLGPMFAAQLLSSLAPPPTLGAAVVILGLIAGAMIFNLAVVAVFLSSPWCLILAVLLVLYVAFYAQRRGAPNLATMALQVGAVAMPALAGASDTLAPRFAANLVQAMAIAILTAWIMHSILPDRAAFKSPAGPPTKRIATEREAAYFALRNTLILAPIVGWYLLDVQIALVLPITLLIVIRQYGDTMDTPPFVGIVLANIVAGVVASIVSNLILLDSNIVVFAAFLFLISLMFGASIFGGGTEAPLLALAFPTFILLLGFGLTPLPGGSEDAFGSRLMNVIAASLYGYGALVLWGRRPA